MAAGKMVRYKKKKAIVYKKKTRPPLPIGGFPKNKMVKLRYVTECVVQCSGLSNSYTYSANGMYDPDITGGGHQPKAFDEWMAVYNHYNVVGSKINVKLVSTHGGDGYIWGVTRTPTPNSLASKLLTYCLENRYTRGYRALGSNPGQRALANIPAITKYSQKKQFGQNSSQKTDLTGNASSNPTEQSYFEVWMAPINNIPTTQTASFIVTIDYIALLTEPRVLAQS